MSSFLNLIMFLLIKEDLKIDLLVYSRSFLKLYYEFQLHKLKKATCKSNIRLINISHLTKFSNSKKYMNIIKANQ